MKRLKLKYLAALILALALPFGLVSCDEGGDDSGKNMLVLLMLTNSGVPFTLVNNMGETVDEVYIIHEDDTVINNKLNGTMPSGTQKDFKAKVGLNWILMYSAESSLSCDFGTWDFQKGDPKMTFTCN